MKDKINLAQEITNYLVSTLNDVKYKLGPWKNIDNMYLFIVNKSHCIRYRKDEQREEWNQSMIIPASLDKLNAKERESVLRYLLSRMHLYEKNLRKKHGDLQKALGLCKDDPNRLPRNFNFLINRF